MSDSCPTVHSEFISASTAQTEAAGEFIGRLSFNGLYIALRGELGGGKTTFVRGLARGLGATGHVQSPTFVLMREYRGRITLFHTDYYRLEKQSELSALDLAQCLADGVLAAEWADKFDAPHGAEIIEINFNYLDDSNRNISFRNATPGAADLAAEIARAINSFKAVT